VSWGSLELLSKVQPTMVAAVHLQLVRIGGLQAMMRAMMMRGWRKSGVAGRMELEGAVQDNERLDLSAGCPSA